MSTNAKRSGNVVWLVVWVVLMLFWLFGGGYAVYTAAGATAVSGAMTIIPWACVLILGLVVFGALDKPR